MKKFIKIMLGVLVGGFFVLGMSGALAAGNSSSPVVKPVVNKLVVRPVPKMTRQEYLKKLQEIRKEYWKKIQVERKAHQEKMSQIHAEVQAIVKTGKCPLCSAGLRRNLSLTGWYQCEQLGAEGFRKITSLPSCSWQGFTQ